MELRHLQAILAIADTGSFSLAAESIGTVQSNVSAHIARLERELDVVLIDRATGRLSEEGEVVVNRARRMMNELDAMNSDIVALRREVIGTVRTGMIGTTGRWLLPQLLDRLRERHPHIYLSVAEGTNTTLELQLFSGRLDLALVTLPVASDDLTTTPLFQEDIVLVLQADHPLAKEWTTRRLDMGEDDDGGLFGTQYEPMNLEDLSQIALLLPAPGTALRHEIDAVIKPRGIVLKPSIELDGVRMIASLTFDGYGPAILPATAVPGHLRNQFIRIPLQDYPRRGVGVALRSHSMPSAAARAVVEILHDTVSDPLTMPEGIHPTGRSKS